MQIEVRLRVALVSRQPIHTGESDISVGIGECGPCVPRRDSTYFRTMDPESGTENCRHL